MTKNITKNKLFVLATITIIFLTSAPSSYAMVWGGPYHTDEKPEQHIKEFESEEKNTPADKKDETAGEIELDESIFANTPLLNALYSPRNNSADESFSRQQEEALSREFTLKLQADHQQAQAHDMLSALVAENM